LGRELKVVGGGTEAVVSADQQFVIGRSRTADLVMRDSGVSRRHLEIESFGDGWAVRDVSANGTWMDGKRIGTVSVRGEARFRLGGTAGPELLLLPSAPVAASPHDGHFDMVTMHPGSPGLQLGPMLPGGNRQGPGGELNSLEREHGRHRVYHLSPGVVSIGRSLDNDIVVGDLLASRTHAELLVGRGGAEIVDLDSATGTFVNGSRVPRGVLGEGDVIAIGHHIFQLVGQDLIEYLDSGDVSFEADGLSVFVGETPLLRNVSFRLPGRALLAVIGPSGAGKSTLLNALTGFRAADQGTVRYAGRDMYSEYDELRRRIGYVPQDDILHTSLTVRQALEYGAELRFPADTSAVERGARVNEVLRELGLTSTGESTGEHDDPDGDGGDSGIGTDLADRKVEKLSGGQRKRTSVALELLTEPTLLYLDEPTSGLDPGLDKEVMTSLRRLADDGRTVIVVTHSVAQLGMCDYVLILAKGGHVAYFGPPAEALPFFEQTDWADVFQSLKTNGMAKMWAARFRASRYFIPASIIAPVAQPIPAVLPSIRQQSVFSQLMTLSRRHLRVIAADKSYLRLIIAFPFLLGIIPQLIPARHGLKFIPDQANRDAPLVLLTVVLCACFMGMTNSVREIVKERAIYRRERSIGLSRTAYLGSKILVLTFITTLQTAVFTTIGLYGREPEHAIVLGSPLLEAIVAVLVVSLASVMVGLVISSLVDNADKAMPLLVLLTMAQLAFSGGLVPVVHKPGLQQISCLFPARWGFAAISSSVDLNNVERLGDSRLNPDTHPDPLWRHTSAVFFTDIAGGVAVAVVAIIITAFLLRRAEPRIKKRPAQPVQPTQST
jgi:ABC-type multidrug transport system ATPase subunit/pSer/pThr/pTyr-binding forkhead associated (FHA) protein